jgi:thiamine pyrophosphokinase
VAVIVIVANAPLCWSRPLVALVRAAEAVVAADGGANHLARIGVMPAAVVGDLDSLRPEVRAWLGEGRLLLRPDQEYTDLHKTLAWVIDERGGRRVTILGGTGGRLDHALANLGLLARWAARAELEMVDATSRIVPVQGERSFATSPGADVSLLPVGRCERVWADGLRWPLAGESLDLAGRTGVCNQAAAPRVTVRVEGGTLLLFLPAPGSGLVL